MDDQLSFNEFREEVLKLRGEKHFKVTNSYTTKDAYRWVKKNKLLPVPLKEGEFGNIIKEVNKALLDKLTSGSFIKFPKGMGTLELRKYKNRIEFNDGKLITNKGIDWRTTLEYWKEDKEAMKARKLIRFNADYTFKVYYIKRKAKYKYRYMFAFSLNREAKRKLREKIINNEVDAFII